MLYWCPDGPVTSPAALHYRRVSATTVALSVAMLPLLLANPVNGAEWAFTPELEAGVGYDDNVDLDERNGLAAWNATTAAGLAAEQATDNRRLRFRGVVGWTAYEGAREAPENEDFQSIQGQSRFQRERTTWRLDGIAHREESQIDGVGTRTPEDPLSGIDPGSDIDAAGDERTVTRHRVFLTPSFSQELTERWSMGASYVGRYIGFEDDVPGDVESLNHELEIRTDHALTARLDLGVSAFAALFRPRGDGREVDTVGLALNVGYALSERSGVNLSAGARRSEPDADGDSADAETGFVGRLQGYTRGERWQGSVTVERRLLPSSRGTLNETDQLILSTTRELSPRWELGGIARAFTRRVIGDDALRGETRRYAAVRPRLSYRLTPDWSIDADYEFQLLRRVGGDRDATGHAVFIGIRYNPERELGLF